MKNRILTSVSIIALLILAFFAREISVYIFDVLALLLAVTGVFEFSKMISKANLYNNKFVGMAYPVLAYLVLIFEIIFDMPVLISVAIQLSLIVFLFAFVFLFGLIAKKQTQNEMITRKIGTSLSKFCFQKALNTLLTFFYPSVLILMLVIINHFGDFGVYTGDYGKQISFFALLLVVVIPIISDTFAMLCGNLFKGKKLCPNISPNKTISGAIGGLVFAVLISCCIYVVFTTINSYMLMFSDLNIKFWHIIVLSFVASLLCQLGDLFESFVKRKAQIKDSGDFFPGHGGILDRFDSHLFCYLPVLCYLLFLI